MITLILAAKFLKKRSDQRFISFLSQVATVGLCLGIVVLTVVMSVMNGFNEQMLIKFKEFDSHVQIKFDKPIDAQRANYYLKTLSKLNGVEKITAHNWAQAVVFKDNDSILPVNIQSTGSIESNAALSNIKPPFSIHIACDQMYSTNFTFGDELTLVTPKMEKRITGNVPKTYKVTIGKCFPPSHWSVYNATMDMSVLQMLYHNQIFIDGYVIKVDQIDKLPFYLSKIKSKIKDPARVIDLSNIIKPVIRAFHMQKILMI